MGLPVSVHVRGAVSRPDLETAVGQVFSQLRRVDRVFSTWRDDSDLMKVRAGTLAHDHAHPWLEEVEDLCRVARSRTGGLFDAGYGAGYDAGAGHGAGYDPTGLVKGWAVERAAAYLRLVPGISFCVNAGGDLVAGAGRDTAPSTWQVGVEDPRRPGVVAATVPLRTGGLATSGTAARGAHIIDPRSREPLSRKGSVSVWGPSLLWADVWATALFVDPAVGEALMKDADSAYRALVL